MLGHIFPHFQACFPFRTILLSLYYLAHIQHMNSDDCEGLVFLSWGEEQR